MGASGSEVTVTAVASAETCFTVLPVLTTGAAGDSVTLAHACQSLGPHVSNGPTSEATLRILLACPGWGWKLTASVLGPQVRVMRVPLAPPLSGPGAEAAVVYSVDGSAPTATSPRFDASTGGNVRTSPCPHQSLSWPVPLPPRPAAAQHWHGGRGVAYAGRSDLGSVKSGSRGRVGQVVAFAWGRMNSTETSR